MFGTTYLHEGGILSFFATQELKIMQISKGLQAATVATVVLSILMVMKSMMGIMPELDLPKMIAGMMGAPERPIVGWVVHFMIGIVLYGLAMAFIEDVFSSGRYILHGMIIGFAGWLIMMVMLMPMAGAGMFGMKMGIMAPVMTLMLHLIFGAVLGWAFG
jgi:hypothetical protein